MLSHLKKEGDENTRDGSVPDESQNNSKSLFRNPKLD